MTTITNRTSYKDCTAILNDPGSSEDLKNKALERQDSIKAWLKKRDAEKGSSSPQQAASYKADELNISGIDIKQDQKDEIMKETEDGTKRLLIVLSGVQRICRESGIEHPATIGMVFNQVCENRR